MTSTSRQETKPEATVMVRPDSASGALLVAIMVSGLFAGFFGTYTFSVTRGLSEVSDVTYVESFQAINATIKNPWFALIFFGSAPATLLALVLARKANRGYRGLLMAGLGLIVLTMVVTFVGNVPLNDSLGLIEASDPQVASEARGGFEDQWNMLNVARTALSACGFACVAMAGLSNRVPS